ncbi:vWA domain-containing protein [Roseovarius sp. 2305UL8-3]|uniref:vWA domain-containing protein n=1 Tax=Roseovarius conchicola TaxID=3121636 RepID=UPI0035291364
MPRFFRASRHIPLHTRRIVLFAALLGCAFAAGCNDGNMAGIPAADSADMGAALEAPAPVAEAMIVAEPAPVSSGRWQNPRRGVVTAGDIDDALNLAAFKSYQGRTAKDLRLPQVNLRGAVRVQLTGSDGKPASGVPVTLRKPGADEPFYQGHSGVDGWVTAFPAALGTGAPKRVQLRAFGEGQQVHDHSLPTGSPNRSTLPFNSKWQPDFLDLVFVFDTTGSMGDELSWLTKEFGGIVQAARRSAPRANIRFGLVAYRDRGDAYVVRNFGFTNRQAQMQSWLRSLDANGGGDYPEAAAAALQSAVGLNWRRGKGERILFHIADAPPHKSEARAYLDAARGAAKKNIQIFGLGASGVAEESEFLMRQAALVTAGRYLFLTDDSGVGLSHAEPSTACYRVTRLKSLLVRVLQSELSGVRKEASDSEVLREVGTYHRGVCKQ